jgi:hypothetical protein
VIILLYLDKGPSKLHISTLGSYYPDALPCFFTDVLVLSRYGIDLIDTDIDAGPASSFSIQIYHSSLQVARENGSYGHSKGQTGYFSMRYPIFVGEEFHRLIYKQSGIFVNNTDM